jgi:hypothetical protein
MQASLNGDSQDGRLEAGCQRAQQLVHVLSERVKRLLEEFLSLGGTAGAGEVSGESGMSRMGVDGWRLRWVGG